MQYGVFYHHVRRSLNPHGGRVVRPVDETHRALDFYNYGDVVPLRVFKSERAADNFIARTAERAA